MRIVLPFGVCSGLKNVSINNMFFKTKVNEEAHKNSYEVEVREDEEQSVKFQEIIDLLVAAGYFRARIKGLLPFDRVVGGMTWCIESCNVDVDVDLLFQENSTIGQKIALTEKIVALLPKIKCPHNIEPHQIQGLDFIHIFPVIQWLVKRSLEFRQAISDYARSYAVTQFNKGFNGTVDITLVKSGTNILKHVNIVKEVYLPHRYYKCTNATLTDIHAQVQITLLEYGNVTGSVAAAADTGGHEEADHEYLNEEDIKTLTEHYTSLQLEFKRQDPKFLKKKQLSIISDEVNTLVTRSNSLNLKISSLKDTFHNIVSHLGEVQTKQKDVEIKLEALKNGEISKPDNIQEIEELIILSEDLKTQESLFKEYCKEELIRLQEMIQNAKKRNSVNEEQADENNICEELSENVAVLRLQLAKQNRTVVGIHREIDEAPRGPELAQYQRRFLELYNQISAKHKETKQYYTLYNTMEDTKVYMKKELSLLNSISDNYPEALLSNYAKDEFLNQFQNIVEGMNQSKDKVEKQLLDEKKKRDHLSALLQILIDQQRKYVSAVRKLSIECKKHEILMLQYKS